MNPYNKNDNQTQKLKNFDHPQQEEFNWGYDYDNRQISYDDPVNTNNATYTYNAAGTRIAKTVNSVTEKYIHDGANVIVDYDGSDAVKATYVTPFLDQNLLVFRGGNTYYFQADGLGSIRELIDSSENTKNSYDYYAFGAALNWSETVENRYTFTAREWDKESRIYDYRARNNDPFIGRFLQRDPEGYDKAGNLYVYAENNTTVFVDPKGRKNFIIAIKNRLTGTISESRCDCSDTTRCPVHFEKHLLFRTGVQECSVICKYTHTLCNLKDVDWTHGFLGLAVHPSGCLCEYECDGSRNIHVSGWGTYFCRDTWPWNTFGTFTQFWRKK